MRRDRPSSIIGNRPALNRVVRITTTEKTARAVIEDDFHHFRVEVVHDGLTVTRIRADSLRNPYSLCPAAGFQLNVLRGASLDRSLPNLLRTVNARQQCTHQLDIALLAMSAAARGTVSRRYDAVVTDAGDFAANPTPREATLFRDGEIIADWAVEGSSIVEPATFAGVGLRRGFLAWVADHLGDEDAEAALVLRGAFFVSSGRGKIEQLDAMPHAPATAGCWVQQPERAEISLRERGSTLDFSERPAMLTVADDDWLEFLDLG